VAVLHVIPMGSGNGGDRMMIIVLEAAVLATLIISQ
jgi:hypothetical protein